MGSFYNVVSFRLAREESLIYPSSHCDNCRAKLKASDLIPIFSYLFLKGKCRYCHKKISIFNLISEIFSGTLFAVSYYSFGFSYELLLVLALSSLFVIVMSTDLNFYIIPDEINIFFAILFFIINIFTHGFVKALEYGVYGLIMFILMYLLMLIGNFLLKEESLGGGDIKLLFALGMTLPIVMSFISLTLGALLALPASAYYYFKHKDKAIPFGPFLVAGFLIILLLKIDPSKILDFLIIK